jgi:hypothetical protein
MSRPQTRRMDTIIGHLFSCRFYGSAGIKPTFMHHPKELYNILFKSSWATLKQFGTNKNHLGVEPVMIGFLHAWGQNLSLHPHLHCIVPGGGVSKAGHWKMAKNKGKYLFNV